MKQYFNFLALLLPLVFILSCSKNTSQPATTTTGTTYASVQDFLTKNAPPIQTYSVDAANGGSFTTPQGTVVTIPANNFTLPSGRAATGTITVEFLDIYKKSDMLLADVSTDFGGRPLKCGGEFFISAKAGDSVVQIVNRIDVQQPANGPIDSMMAPFTGVANNDTNNIQFQGNNRVNWVNNDSIPNPKATDTAGIGGNGNIPRFIPICTESLAQSEYVFSLYNFASPAASGTWCNSDNSGYFSSYPLTKLTLVDTSGLNTTGYNTSYVFLVFKNINCMVHVYEYGYNANSFPYNYAPQGLQCTIVAINVNAAGNLYASFTPITIGSNQTGNFGLSPITDVDFKTKLTALN
jgi:hypothetical protein